MVTYDHVKRDLLESLFELDKYEIKIVPTRWGNTPQNQLNPTTDVGKKIIENCVTQIQKQPDIFVQLTVVNEFEPIGKYNIGITAGSRNYHHNQKNLLMDVIE